MDTRFDRLEVLIMDQGQRLNSLLQSSNEPRH